VVSEAKKTCIFFIVLCVQFSVKEMNSKLHEIRAEYMYIWKTSSDMWDFYASEVFSKVTMITFQIYVYWCYKHSFKFSGITLSSIVYFDTIVVFILYEISHFSLFLNLTMILLLINFSLSLSLSLSILHFEF
jgi:hypothetical protein